MGLLGAFDVDGRAIDDERALGHRGHDVLPDRQHVPAGRKHRDNDAGAFHGRNRAFRDGGAVRFGLIARGRDEIERDHRVASLDEIGRHRATHVAETDERNAGHLEFLRLCSCYSNTSSSAPIPARYGASISDVTSSIRGGDHLGLRSLSITAARMPSRKSSLRKTSSAARYSRTRHSSSDAALRASRNNLKVTTMPRGDFSFSTFSVDCASSESSPFSSLKISSIRSCANQRSISARLAATGPAASPVAKPAMIVSTSADVAPGRAAVKASRNAGSLPDGTTTSAKREKIASAPFMVCPVSPK